MTRTILRKLTGSRSVDGTCRNKTCPACQKSYKHKRRKQEPIAS